MGESTKNILGASLIDLTGLGKFWDNAKLYIDGQKTAATNYTDSVVGVFASEGVPATGLSEQIANRDTAVLTSAKEYTDTAKSGAIESANAHTNTEIGKLSTKIDAIIAGGVTFTGVVEDANGLTGKDVNGGVITVKSSVSEFTVGDYTFKPGYEYIYYKPHGTDTGVWYELGDSDKNSKAISDLDVRIDLLEDIAIADEDDIVALFA